MSVLHTGTISCQLDCLVRGQNRAQLAQEPEDVLRGRSAYAGSQDLQYTYLAGFLMLHITTAALRNLSIFHFDSDVIVQVEKVRAVVCFPAESHPDVVVVLHKTYLGSPA